MRRAFVATVLVAACASRSTANDDAGAAPVTAQAIVSTNGGESGACLPAFRLGSFDPTRPVRNDVKDGESTVRVECTVAPSGEGFLVHAAVSTQDARGTFGLDVPKMPANGNLTASPADIVIVWGSSEGGYGWGDAPTCKLDTTTRAAAGIARGRYGATFACTGLKTRDGVPCTLLGEIRLENCAQTL